MWRNNHSSHQPDRNSSFCLSSSAIRCDISRSLSTMELWTRSRSTKPNTSANWDIVPAGGGTPPIPHEPKGGGYEPDLQINKHLAHVNITWQEQNVTTRRSFIHNQKPQQTKTNQVIHPSKSKTTPQPNSKRTTILQYPPKTVYSKYNAKHHSW